MIFSCINWLYDHPDHKIVFYSTLPSPYYVWAKIALFNPNLHGGGSNWSPDGLSYTNPCGMPWMGWFFMTLFLSILERSWVGHFWDFFLKFPKNFSFTIFSTYNPKGGPFYTRKNALIFGSFLVSKMVIIQLQMHK